jgi:hypothetical protein
VSIIRAPRPESNFYLLNKAISEAMEEGVSVEIDMIDRTLMGRGTCTHVTTKTTLTL